MIKPTMTIEDFVTYGTSAERDARKPRRTVLHHRSVYDLHVERDADSANAVYAMTERGATWERSAASFRIMVRRTRNVRTAGH